MPACPALPAGGRQAGNGRQGTSTIMFYVYVLKLRDDTYYKGQSENVNARLETHVSGEVKSTRNKLPFKVVHVEICESRVEARKIEKFFKSGYGREIIHELDSLN